MTDTNDSHNLKGNSVSRQRKVIARVALFVILLLLIALGFGLGYAFEVPWWLAVLILGAFVLFTAMGFWLAHKLEQTARSWDNKK